MDAAAALALSRSLSPIPGIAVEPTPEGAVAFKGEKGLRAPPPLIMPPPQSLMPPSPPGRDGDDVSSGLMSGGGSDEIRLEAEDAGT